MNNNKLRFANYNLFICILFTILISVFAFPGLATIATYPCSIFGSKVVLGDLDEGNPLNHCCHDLGFYDIGREKNVYDEQDPVYLDMDWDRIISINDIRITPFATPFAIYLPGSKVKRTDLDINESLINFTNWSIAYVDLNNDNIYGLHDPLYLHDRNHGDKIVSGDIRLTSFQVNPPGTRVMSHSADGNSSCIDLMGVSTPDPSARIVRILFFNANGNYLGRSAIYDWPDTVYLHIFNSSKGIGEGVIGFVGVNDLRLSL